MIDVDDLADLRAEAESQMLDTFAAYAPAGTTTDGDGMETPAYETKGTVAGKIQARFRAGIVTREVEVADVRRGVIEASLHISMDSPPPVEGDLGAGWEYEMTVAGPTTPAEMVGSRWLVTGRGDSKTFQTARRLDVVRIR